MVYIIWLGNEKKSSHKRILLQECLFFHSYLFLGENGWAADSRISASANNPPDPSPILKGSFFNPSLHSSLNFQNV
jgi:hypothetical protein